MATRKPSKPRYAGTLAKPVAFKPLGLMLLLDDVACAKHAQAHRDEITAKLPELFKAHGVALGDWPSLAIALAVAHVPGFQSVRAPGRKVAWSALDKAEFRLWVERLLIADEGLSIPGAIAIVRTIAGWAAEIETEGLTPDELREHFDSNQHLAQFRALAQWADKTAGMKFGALRKHFDSADKRLVRMLNDIGPP